MDSHNIDLEQAQPEKSSEPSSIPNRSPTGTSATIVSKSCSSATVYLGEFKLDQLVRKWLSYFRRSKPDEAEEGIEETLPEGPGIITRTLESCPKGYPNLAAFLDSDENFMLYRRFGYLQSRILLHKQDELRALEDKLDILDGIDAAEPNTQRFLKSRDLDDKSKRPRKALLDTIEIKFNEYAELLKSAQAMLSFNKPARRDYKSVMNFFEDEVPLCSEDELYIYRKEDIITLKPGRENAWLDGIIERVLQKLTCAPLRYLFRSAETRAKSTGKTVYYTRSRIDTLVTFLIAIMILILLIVPVYILWHLSQATVPSTSMIIMILLIFTLLFSAVLSFFTRARRHEIFAAAAAYCAVLVVFISNVGQGMYYINH